MKINKNDGQNELDEMASQPSDPAPMEATKKTAQSLIRAYLAANLDFKDIPLKQFMDDCEKKILLDCLRLNRGSQKNTAALLGLKPTALFEKIRKHGIDIRQIKQFRKIAATPPEEDS